MPDDFGIDTPTEKLVKRVEALEKKKLTLKDLPLRLLREAIFLDEPQDPRQTLLPKSVTADVLADNIIGRDQMLIKIDIGTCQFPFVASEFANNETIQHNLKMTPTSVVVTAQDSSITPAVGTFTDADFIVGARYRNVVTGTGTGTWIAIAMLDA